MTTGQQLALAATTLAMASPALVEARGTSIADNIQTVTPRDAEACHAPKLFFNPRLQETSTGRILSRDLRAVAKRGDAWKALAHAAAHIAAGDVVMGNAYADLSVTGRRAYASFLRSQRGLTASALAARAKTTTRGRRLSDSALRRGADRALDRAYRVAHWLRFGRATPRGFRESLGFIAVSGEDDLPWRPVNNDASSDFQYNLPVRVGGITVDTRFIVAGPTAPRPVAYRRRTLTAVPPLRRLPANAKVLVFVHGMDSRLEEAGDLIAALRRNHRGDNWVVISMDLPSSGYASHLDHRRVAPLNAMGTPKTVGFDAKGRHTVKILDFMTDFVVRFVETLDRKNGAKGKVWAVMGGSLGGNITFRLGRRSVPWIRNVVTWSPASIWDSFAGDIAKELGLKLGWKRAGGDAGYARETPGQRATFFKEAFDDKAPFAPSQDAQWWGDSFRCKSAFRKAARVDRFEIYDEAFRKWRWRLGAEQLLYTHRRPHNGRSELFLRNRVPMLLVAGAEDNFHWTHIHDATRSAARMMSKTPGRALFLRRTGHSIHNERPNYFAKQIVSFLKRSQVERDRRERATFRTVEILGTTTVDDIRKNGNSRGWVGVKLKNGQIVWSEITSQANKGRRNLAFRTTVRLGRRVRADDIAALLVRHHSGSCFACSRDYWHLRAELRGGGATLVRTGDLRIGHQTRTFSIR